MSGEARLRGFEGWGLGFKFSFTAWGLEFTYATAWALPIGPKVVPFVVYI